RRTDARDVAAVVRALARARLELGALRRARHALGRSRAPERHARRASLASRGSATPRARARRRARIHDELTGPPRTALAPAAAAHRGLTSRQRERTRFRTPRTRRGRAHSTIAFEHSAIARLRARSARVEFRRQRNRIVPRASACERHDGTR